MPRKKVPDALVVVGGVYRERCARPHWDEIYGSAGRAASALARLGARVELHAYADALSEETIRARAAFERFVFRSILVPQTLAFDYHHGLDVPRIGGRGEIKEAIQVEAKNVVRFGMLEGDALVRADRVVYDPQDGIAPVSYRVNGSSARHLAIVLNRAEAELLTGRKGQAIERIARALRRQEAADAVVIKNGPQGALVLEGDSFTQVPAFASERVWKIGSGDMFVAHFAYHWLAKRRSAAKSAALASRATAFYCETRGAPSASQLEEFSRPPVLPSARFRRGRRPRVYLAGPFFTLATLWMIEQARACLAGAGLDVLSPYHDVGHGSAHDVVPKDLEAIEAADIVFAIGDGMDPGTVYEVGYARAKGKPVIVYCENETAEGQKMMQGSGCFLVDDFVSAIYRALWIACAI
jgi:nucleoside 2-deoxyribosyltransferase